MHHPLTHAIHISPDSTLVSQEDRVDNEHADMAPSQREDSRESRPDSVSQNTLRDTTTMPSIAEWDSVYNKTLELISVR